jgi:hypothetical protein
MILESENKMTDATTIIFVATSRQPTVTLGSHLEAVASYNFSVKYNKPRTEHSI